MIAKREKRVTEHTVQDRIIDALSRMPDVVIHRNLVGTYETVKAGWIRAGLGPGTADLIGWVTCYWGAHPDRTLRVARFLALEIKVPGGEGRNKTREAEQAAWLEMVRSKGGIACIVHSPQEATDLIERAKRWEV